MNETPNTPETKWLPILSLLVIGFLLFVLPQTLPFLFAEWSRISARKDASDFQDSIVILTAMVGLSKSSLVAILIREFMSRFGGWKKLLPFSLAAFAFDSIILAPPVYEYDVKSSGTRGLSSLLDAVSSNPPPTTSWWLLPMEFTNQLSQSVFLICITELLFPHQRQRVWLSSWTLGICGVLAIALQFLEFSKAATFTQGGVSQIAFSVGQAVLGAGAIIGILSYSMTRPALSFEPYEKPEPCLTPSRCGAGAVAFFFLFYVISFTEITIARFGGTWHFQNTLMRLSRAIADVVLLGFAVRLLLSVTQMKGWGDRQLIGLLLGGYATKQVYEALGFNIFGDMGPVFRWTSFVVNLAALLFAGFLFRWLWKHQPSVLPGPTTQ